MKINKEVEDNFANKHIKMIDNLLANTLKGFNAVNETAKQAMLMVLKFEMGQYILNKTLDTNYKISVKGQPICNSVYEALFNGLTAELEKFNTDPFELGFIRSKSLNIIGNKLFEDNNLGVK